MNEGYEPMINYVIIITYEISNQNNCVTLYKPNVLNLKMGQFPNWFHFPNFKEL